MKSLHRRGEYYADVMAMNSDGTGMSHRLQREVDRLGLLPFDDGVMEQAHNFANRVHKHAPAAGWAWIAATCRLAQNTRDIRSLAALLGLDLQSEYRNRGTLLQIDRGGASPAAREASADFAKVI